MQHPSLLPEFRFRRSNFPLFATEEVNPTLDLDQLRVYWEWAYDLTVDFDKGIRFSGPRLINTLNERIEKGQGGQLDPLTKVKLDYLRDQGIIEAEAGGGEQRTSWRYTPHHAREVLVAEILKQRHNIRVQDIRLWLNKIQAEHEVKSTALARIQRNNDSFVNGSGKERTSLPGAEIVTIENRGISMAASTNPAIILLRNRILATLAARWIDEYIDEHVKRATIASLIAFRIIRAATPPSPPETHTWDTVVRDLRPELSWHFAVSFPPDGVSPGKRYYYDSLEELVARWSEMSTSQPPYQWEEWIWHKQTLSENNSGRAYEIIVGLDIEEAHSGNSLPPLKLVSPTAKHSLFSIEERLGLATLLHVAFPDGPLKEYGTPLKALAEIIARAVPNAWDYCAIMLPKQADRGEVRLCVTEYGGAFPRGIRGKCVGLDQYISGRAYQFCRTLVVEPTIGNDPRLGYYADERPHAAAAAPIVIEKNGELQKLGAVYVGRAEPPETRVFSDERVAALKMLATICGELIARDDTETAVVQTMETIAKEIAGDNQKNNFKAVKDLFAKVADTIEAIDISPEMQSWVHILTVKVNIRRPETEALLHTLTEESTRLTLWLYTHICEVAQDFFVRLLEDKSIITHEVKMGEVPLIGYSEVEENSGQFVFATLTPNSLSEAEYKKELVQFREELAKISLPGLEAEVYPWGIYFPYARLQRELKEHGKEYLASKLTNRVKDTVKASHYITRGHDAFRENKQDDAVKAFKDALLEVPGNPYLHKHLAEAYLLKGNFDRTIFHCEQALSLDAEDGESFYASAYCLKADAHAYQSLYDEAYRAYNQAVKLSPGRWDFLIRYGNTLVTEIVRGRILTSEDEPWTYEQAIRAAAQAIQKFNQAEGLDPRLNSKPNLRAQYRYHRGYAYLQAGLVEEALEEFGAGRRLDPTDLRLSQVYSQARSLRGTTWDVTP